MNDFARSVATALSLIGSLDPELLGIIGLSLRVSLSASLIGLVIGAPFGAWLAISPFPGRQVIVVLTNALLGLPPVVVGLGLYLLLSRSGPLGSAGGSVEDTSGVAGERGLSVEPSACTMRTGIGLGLRA